LRRRQRFLFEFGDDSSNTDVETIANILLTSNIILAKIWRERLFGHQLHQNARCWMLDARHRIETNQYFALSDTIKNNE